MAIEANLSDSVVGQVNSGTPDSGIRALTARSVPHRCPAGRQ
jgi:hypothetical protein